MSADGTGGLLEAGECQERAGEMGNVALSEGSVNLLRFLLGVSAHSPDDGRRLCDELLGELGAPEPTLVPAVQVLRDRLEHEFRFGVGKNRVDVKRGVGNVAIVLREHRDGVVVLSGKMLLQHLHANRHK